MMMPNDVLDFRIVFDVHVVSCFHHKMIAVLPLTSW